MKYIRTKDGIYTDDNLHIVTKVSEDSNIKVGDKIIVTNKGFIKVDDKDIAFTIEELCDAFVMFCPNAIRRKIRVYETMQSISLYSKRDKRWNGNMVDKVYGAIWTDKGLIYVAKMNDKGELELL